VTIEVIEKGRSTPEHPTPLLFVHGALLSAWCWDEHFLDYFAQRGYRALALSFRGHGRSPTDKPLNRCSIADYLEDVCTVAETLPTAPVMIGHSMGGYIVQKYLRIRQVPAAVLLASVPPSGFLAPEIRTLLRHPLRSIAFTITGKPSNLVATTNQLRRMYFSPSTTQSTLDTTNRRLQPESARVLHTDLVLRPTLNTAAIDTPLLVMGAEHDGIFRPREIHATAAAYRTTANIIPNIGHMMMLDNEWPTAAGCIDSWLSTPATYQT
jgi:pimeloyl-ACP methyl ester carboxylesterase